MMHDTKTGVKAVEVIAQVTRADGTVEPPVACTIRLAPMWRRWLQALKNAFSFRSRK